MTIDFITVAHMTLLVLIIAAAVYAVKSRDLLMSTMSLAAMSLMVSLEFLLLGAPDVAIAEAGIGAALTSAIYILAIRSTKRMEDDVYE